MTSLLKGRGLLFAAFLLLSAAFSARAWAAYDAIYVFGDSYCDVGNIYLATNGADPVSPPYFNGRFSNGPIWIEHVANAMNLSLLPALAGGTDYAFGGAWATVARKEGAAVIPDVPGQVALYLAEHGGKADPQALYILEGGGNDILGNLATGIAPSKLGLSIAGALAASELLLRRAGARHFVVPELLNVGLLPAAAANPSFAEAASLAANGSLDLLLAVESRLEGVDIRKIRLFNLFETIQADPNHFGFSNITTPCFDGVTVCADPDHTLFWDSFHPTEFGQAFFAVTFATELNP